MENKFNKHEDTYFGAYAEKPYEEDGDIIVSYTNNEGEDIGYYSYNNDEYRRW